MVLLYKVLTYATAALNFLKGGGVSREARNNAIITPKEEIHEIDLNKIDAYTKTASKQKPHKDKRKYILIWTTADKATKTALPDFGEGRGPFLLNNCAYNNCFITRKKELLGGDITKFDAVAFDICNVECLDAQLPKTRSPRQKFIAMTKESAYNCPICPEALDNYFNWTFTYRLDSDVIYHYFKIKNSRGEIVGPKLEMKWNDTPSRLNSELVKKLHFKTKVATWFSSNCESKSGREKYVYELQKALHEYGLKVDIYGECGPFRCNSERKCLEMISKDYFFYLAFEDSIAEDYVSDEVLKALIHDAVPIVFGGANYSRFLPPKSYIDASKFTPRHLAAVMKKLMREPKLYLQFFNWRNYYTYHHDETICSLCSALNDEGLLATRSVYKELRLWWNSDYHNRCKSYFFDRVLHSSVCFLRSMFY